MTCFIQEGDSNECRYGIKMYLMGIGYFVLIVYVLFLFWMIYRIIVDYDNRNPVKTICWILVVVFIPVLGVVAYYMVGRNITKKRSKFQKWRNEFNRRNQRQYKVEKDDPVYTESCRELKALILSLEQSPVFTGNRIEVFPDGKSKFHRLLRDIDLAQDHIHIFYYAIGDDRIGNKLKNKLIEKAKQGIEVRLIYDGLGCNKTNENYFSQMIEAGVEVKSFLPLSFPRLLRSINYRNHKKIVLIDGKIAYTGGINVKDEYIDGLSWGKWNDTHFKVEGPGAMGLQSVFLADWYYVSGQYLSSLKYYPTSGIMGEAALQVVNAEPLGIHANIKEALFTAITRARKYVYIETPYFVPTECLIRAIQTVAMSGIDVRLIIPKRSDNVNVQYASNSYVEELLRNKVKVYQYVAGFTHSKLMIIDDELTIVGSGNLDVRSLELLFETNLFIYNKNVAKTVKHIYLNDLADSEEVNLQAWMNRGKGVRLCEACFRLMSPLF